MKNDLEMMLMMDDVRQALDLHSPEVVDLMVCAQRLMVSAIGQIADRRDTPEPKLRQLADSLADTLRQAMHQRIDNIGWLVVYHKNREKFMEIEKED
jgi:predicted metalloendopeptidase